MEGVDENESSDTSLADLTFCETCPFKCAVSPIKSRKSPTTTIPDSDGESSPQAKEMPVDIQAKLGVRGPRLDRPLEEWFQSDDEGSSSQMSESILQGAKARNSSLDLESSGHFSEDKEVISRGLLAIGDSSEENSFAISPACKEEDPNSCQAQFEDKALCQMMDDGFKYWSTPRSLSVVDSCLVGTPVKRCCGHRHYKPVGLKIHLENGISVDAFLTHAGVSRLLGMDSSTFFDEAALRIPGRKAFVEDVKMFSFTKLHTSGNYKLKLLCYSRDNKIHVSGVVFK